MLLAWNAYSNRWAVRLGVVIIKRAGLQLHLAGRQSRTL